MNELALFAGAGGGILGGHLMGWPTGWTDLKPLAMDRFHEWQRQHSLSSLATETAA